MQAHSCYSPPAPLAALSSLDREAILISTKRDAATSKVTQRDAGSLIAAQHQE